MFSCLENYQIFQGLDELFIILGQLWPVNNNVQRTLMASEQ
ncbi:5760_t:CDS:2 [Funneliformis geosporum]|uniref:5760_t:CDS:1 n=1 Tax=Funneliformis geosporum TaxID=1117311 RepID=A0A9W4SJS5_9GLOM|nr:5760_t:CDS:2 [Funneliformis geosporum]